MDDKTRFIIVDIVSAFNLHVDYTKVLYEHDIIEYVFCSLVRET